MPVPKEPSYRRYLTDGLALCVSTLNMPCWHEVVIDTAAQRLVITLQYLPRYLVDNVTEARALHSIHASHTLSPNLARKRPEPRTVHEGIPSMNPTSTTVPGAIRSPPAKAV